MAASTATWAQNPSPSADKLSFQDSVRTVLENTRSTDAVDVGVNFATAWSKIGRDQQQVIRQQVKLMKRKGYKLRPQFINYYGAIANAINKENADVTTFSGFLSVAGQVVENQTLTQAATFFKNSKDFFEYHALHYDRSFRLFVRDDEYHFDYVQTEILPSLDFSDSNTQPDNFDNDNFDNDNFDDTADQNQFDQWDNQDTQEDFNWDEPVETELPPAMPIWMQPAPQPILTGPLIRFDKVTFNFSTSYDSAFLTGTKGAVSLLDNTFVGEGGRFDWRTTG
ncbi:MAG: hypothetical protein RIA63_02710, partial [Cyclobacteriaceae bacterium]